MPLIKLQFKPGMNRDSTEYANEGGWWACDKVRFRSGFPEKLGGWTKTVWSPFIGYCRQMWAWVTTFNDVMLALGTNVKVYIYVGSTFYDITPLRTLNPTFVAPVTTGSINTTVGTKTITVVLTSPHEATEGQYVQISGVAGTTIGGIPVTEINGNHEILTVLTPTSFTYLVTTTATSTVAAAGGAGITMSFEIPPGYAISTAGYGWGTGVWGRGTWGSGVREPVFQPLRDWWFDNFDNDLVMNIRNGEGYWWERGTFVDPGVALAAKAVRLVTYSFNQATAFIAGGGLLPWTAAQYRDAVPVKIMQLLLSQQDRHLIAFGAVPFGYTSPNDFDPMLIRWADQDTPWDWFPDVTNTAGDIRLSRGSKIVRALPTRQEILVWTDTTLYTLQFLGNTDVFGVQEYAENVSIISPRACISASNVTYWMGKDQFYIYTGRVETLPCTLRQHVFQDLNPSQRDQIVCGTNEEWHEIWWFYPSFNSDYNDSYVVYNHLEQVWFYGKMPRTAWLDTPLMDYPLACNTVGPAFGPDDPVPSDEPGYLFNHESGLDDDDMPMVSYIQSSDIDLDEGDKYMLIKRLIPDVSFTHSLALGVSASTSAAPSPRTHGDPEVTIQMRPRNFPGAPSFIEPSDSQDVLQTTVGQFTEQVFIRARARQMAFKIMSDDLGVQWSLGTPRLDVKPDGMR